MSSPSWPLASHIGGSHPVVVNRRIRDLLVVSAGALIAAAAAFTIAVGNPEPDVLVIFGITIGVVAVFALMLSPRYELTLALLVIYLGVLDGPIKQEAASKAASGIRNILIIAIALGMLMRVVARKERLRLPPLAGWVLSFVAVVLIEALNPNTHGFLKALGGYRQQLEWVPMFFFGYLIFRRKDRFRQLFLILGVIALANGVVGTVQSRMSPQQLAKWGPGYSGLVKGGHGGLSGRTYASEGVARVRPPALGSDAGFGGGVGVVALPGLLALLAVGRQRRRWPVLLCALGAVLGIATSASRTSVVVAVVTLLVFAGLSVVAGLRVSRPLASLLVIVVMALAAGSVLIAADGKGIFARQETLTTLQRAQETGGEGKEKSLSQIPSYLAHAPFGFGLGTAGSVSGFGGKQKIVVEEERVAGGSAYSLLMKELGVLGLVLWIGLSLNVILIGVRRLRLVRDRELRTYLVAMLTAFVALTVEGFSGPTLAVTVGAYLWLVPGVIAYWLVGAGRTDAASSPAVAS
ncbi:MAG TPA: hypothetical protein VLJ80_10275 [Solirubrobacteraceae bacterium]|nr:hypothetical protein [Solirubrobacteraceae bacterium]